MLASCMKIGELPLYMTSESVEVMNWLEMYCKHQDDGKVLGEVKVHVDWGWGKPFTSFDVDITRDAKWIVYNRGDYQVKIDSNYEHAIVSVHDAFALKHALMNLYSAVIVHLEWGLLIHSSCVVKGKGAYLFAGRSGAGKSTVAQLSSPSPLLSDEATIVKITASAVIVYDSPFRSDTIPDVMVEPCPLAAIHVIHQANYVRRSVKKKIEGIYDLMDKVFYWPHEATETAKILRLYDNLVANVPIYDLYFKKDKTFWEEIS